MKVAYGGGEDELQGSNPLINIRVRALGLNAPDGMSEEKPFSLIAALYIINDDGSYKEVSHSELLPFSARPKWAYVFHTLFLFGIDQPLRITIYYCDPAKPEMAKNKIIGHADFTAQQIAIKLNEEQTIPIKLPNRIKSRGDLLIFPEQGTACGSTLVGQVQLSQLKVGTFTKLFPSVSIYRVTSKGKRVPLIEFPQTKSKGPVFTFEQFAIPIINISPDGEDARIDIVSYNNGKKKQKLQGEFSTTLQKLKTRGSAENRLIKKDKPVGIVKIIGVKIQRNPTFCDYISRGLKVNLAFGIDFTLYNKNTSSPESLHYRNVNKFNEYESCIQSYGTMLCQYNDQQRFYVFAFGAMNKGVTSHCFPLTNRDLEETVYGFDGIMNIYRSTLPTIQLSSPRMLKPVIERATIMGRDGFMATNTYSIFVILTSGMGTDYQEMIDQIVESSNHAVSLIIIGIGNGDFSKFEIINDHDVVLVNSEGREVKRRNTQFIMYEDKEVDFKTKVTKSIQNVQLEIEEYCRIVGFNPDL